MHRQRCEWVPTWRTQMSHVPVQVQRQVNTGIPAEDSQQEESSLL
jgi:hypothetical protein